MKVLENLKNNENGLNMMDGFKTSSGCFGKNNVCCSVNHNNKHVVLVRIPWDMDNISF